MPFASSHSKLRVSNKLLYHAATLKHQAPNSAFVASNFSVSSSNHHHLHQTTQEENARGVKATSKSTLPRRRYKLHRPLPHPGEVAVCAVKTRNCPTTTATAPPVLSEWPIGYVTNAIDATVCKLYHTPCTDISPMRGVLAGRHGHVTADVAITHTGGLWRAMWRGSQKMICRRGGG